MGIVRVARALLGKTLRDVAPYTAALLAVLFAYSDLVAAFLMVISTGAGTGETLQMYGASTGWSIAAAVPAGTLAGLGTYRLWWHQFAGSSRSLADVFGECADRVVATLDKTGR